MSDLCCLFCMGSEHKLYGKDKRERRHPSVRTGKVRNGIRQSEPEKFETSGPISPKDALEYMKTKKDLVIVDVAAKRWYAQEHFKGAVNIPIEELSADEEKELYLQLPKGRPVVMHCRLGMIVPGAYRTLKQLRPDISEIYYIDGKPLFEAYNEWITSQEK